MLEQVCDYVHNYFDHGFEKRTGTFEISGGMIQLPFLKDGQRFKITGSASYDGIYTYNGGYVYDDDNTQVVQLGDGEFTGTVQAMGVPRSFQAIVNEIIAWQDSYGDAASSPYQSEAFAGYQYVMQGGAGQGNIKTNMTWRDVFRHSLNAYRKLA